MTDIKNQFNDSTFTNTVFQYGEKQIKKNLGQRPFHTDVFLGRDTDLGNVEKEFESKYNLLLLVNGEGGIGKTTLAARYYRDHTDQYTHLAWVYAETSLEQALLSLAPDLGLKFENENTEERLQLLFDVLHQLNKPSLLVIDNANEPTQLENLYRLLHTLDNFHLLITTRVTGCEQIKTYKIETLSDDDAKALFVHYYPKHQAEDDGLLKELLIAIGKNTLVIELLAKHLNACNQYKIHYPLQNLVDDLKTKGIFAIEGKEVDTDYQAKGTSLRKEKPEAILAAMYDLTGLTDAERKLLSVFSVLPAENIPFAQLETLLPKFTELEETLHALSQKGWLDCRQEEEPSFKTSPVIQETVKTKNNEIDKDCAELVSSLIDKLDYDPGTGHLVNTPNYNEALVYVSYAISITGCNEIQSYNSFVLLERLGSYYQTTGDLEKALQYFEERARLEKELYETDKKNVRFKNGLAISYEKLGVTHASLGDLDKALQHFEDETILFKELYEADKKNVEFKNGLAISYSKLGDTHTSLGDLDKALQYFEERARLGKELYETDKKNVGFKNGLAISYSTLGDTHASLGDLDKALQNFVKYNQLKKELYAAYPQNVGFKNGLAISYSKLGDTNTSLGDLGKAIHYFEDDLKLTKELYEAYPQNVGFKNGLAISYSKLGDTYASLSDLDKALHYFEDETILFKELYAAYPQNVGFKNGLAISYSKLGDTHASLGDLDKALQYFDDDLKLTKELFEAYPQDVGFKNGLAISYYKLGVFHRNQRKDAETAKTYFLQAEQLWSELVATSPNHAEFKKNLKQVKKVLASLNGKRKKR